MRIEPILLTRWQTRSRFEGTAEHRKLIVLLSGQATVSDAVKPYLDTHQKSFCLTVSGTEVHQSDHSPQLTELRKKTVRMLVGARRLAEMIQSYAPNTVHQAAIPPSGKSESVILWGEDGSVSSIGFFGGVVMSLERPESCEEKNIFLQ